MRIGVRDRRKCCGRSPPGPSWCSRDRYVRAVLEPVARRFIYCGGPLDVAKAKLTVNTLLGILNDAIAEAYALEVSMGLSSELVLDVLSETPAKAQVERKRALIASGHFEPSFKLRLLLKDIRLTLKEAHRVNRSPKLVALESIEQLAAEAVESTWRELDYSSMAAFVAGTKAPSIGISDDLVREAPRTNAKPD
ncbi:MAG: hypothetical protein C4319_07795 [Acidimicrobiia bacterium]